MCRRIGIVNMENALKKDGGKFMKQKSLKLFKPHWRGLLLTLFTSAALFQKLAKKMIEQAEKGGK